ncbi:MAG: TonB-dependent receptor [Bacteroidaceae bacterium]|nr:TonB-dependent receptor [Bacteroidaceae bacterium]
MKRKFLVIIASLFFEIGKLDAQTISGKVVDSRTGETIIGATVYTADKTKGVVTNYEGEFSIDVAKLPVKLNVSFTGYSARSLIVYDDEESVSITLNEKRSFLNDVVVVGYGSQKRTQLTGAVTTLGKDIISNSPSPSFENILTGTIPGVNVTTNSQPGAASNIRIRGGNSVNASNDPLYVIDGVIYYKEGGSLDSGVKGVGVEGGISPLSLINPNDIESVEILKDVSATAIYGSRGANGVIIVTTKKGERDNAQISYDYSLTIANTSKKLDVLNAKQFAEFQKTYFYNKEGFSDEQIEALGEGTDWQDAVLRTAITNSHNINISGGDTKTRYSISLNNVNQEGIVRNTGYLRKGGRLNFERLVKPGLTAGVMANVSRGEQQGLSSSSAVTYNGSPFQGGITNSLVYALIMPPTVSVYASDGSYNFTNPYEYLYFKSGSTSANPVHDLESTTAKSISDDILGNMFLKYEITPDFVLKASLGFDVENYTQNLYAPENTALGMAVGGIGSIVKRRLVAQQQEYTADYSKQINNANFINALVGFTYQNTEKTNLMAWNYGFSNNSLGVYDLEAGNGINATKPISSISHSDLYSAIARVNYTLLDRYNATATVRADRSSKFANGHNWGVFPSLGLSWNVDKEPFLDAKEKWLDGLKIRASIGTVGNQEIGDNLSVQTYKKTSLSGTSVTTVSNAANEDLKWETTMSFNTGFDLSLFNGKWTFVGDWYYKKTNDLILTVPSDVALTGVSSYTANIGNVVNRGFEFMVGYNPIHKRKQNLELSAFVAYNHNEFTNIGEGREYLDADESYYRHIKGESVGTYFGLLFDGVVQSDEDVSALPTIGGSTLEPGDAKFVDVDDDGKITQNDRVELGHSLPDYTFGFNSSYTWRRLDASVVIQGTSGGSVYNMLRRRLELASDSYNVSVDLLNSWTATNASDVVAVSSVRPMTAYVDSRYIESTDYIRLKTLSVGYTFPLRFIKGSIRLSATASNLFTITGYSGYDPEVSGGVDKGNYPNSRSFTFGCKLSF